MKNLSSILSGFLFVNIILMPVSGFGAFDKSDGLIEITQEAKQNAEKIVAECAKDSKDAEACKLSKAEAKIDDIKKKCQAIITKDKESGPAVNPCATLGQEILENSELKSSAMGAFLGHLLLCGAGSPTGDDCKSNGLKPLAIFIDGLLVILSFVLSVLAVLASTPAIALTAVVGTGVTVIGTMIAYVEPRKIGNK